MQVVDGRQCQAGHLFGFEKVMQIGYGELTAGRAGAVLLWRSEIVRVIAFGDLERALLRQ